MNGRFLSMSIASGAVAFGLLGLLAACAETSSDVPLDSRADASIVAPASEAGNEPGIDANPDDGRGPDAMPRTCSDDNFCHTDLPGRQVLRAVWGDGAGTVWAVSEGGNILRWDGSTWTVHSTNTAARYLTVWGSSPTDVWVGGSTGLLHGTGSNPMSLVFSPVEVPGDASIAIASIWGSGPNDIWAVGGFESDAITYPREARCRVVHYTAGAWTLDDVSTSQVACSRVWGTTQSGVWIAGNSFQLSDPENMYSATPVLGFFRRRVGSSTFEAYDLPTPDEFGGAAASLETANAGADGSIWIFGRTTDHDLGAWHGSTTDGQTFTWMFESRKIDFELSAIWGSATAGTWAVGAYGRVRRWNGSTWSQAALAVSRYPEVAQFYGIWGIADDDLWVVGDNIALHKKPTSTP